MCATMIICLHFCVFAPVCMHTCVCLHVCVTGGGGTSKLKVPRCGWLVFGLMRSAGPGIFASQNRQEMPFWALSWVKKKSKCKNFGNKHWKGHWTFCERPGYPWAVQRLPIKTNFRFTRCTIHTTAGLSEFYCHRTPQATVWRDSCQVGTADWQNSEELGMTWASRNSFSYGRAEAGVSRPEVLQSLLKTTDRIVQQIDSVEYGLTDIQVLSTSIEASSGELRCGLSIVKCVFTKVWVF